MVPVEVDVQTHRRLNFDPRVNTELTKASLDLVEEERVKANLIAAAYQ